MHPANATPKIAKGESSPSAASAPATMSVGIAGIGMPSCSSSTFAKTSASPYCAIRRSMDGRAGVCGCRAASGPISEALASGPPEAPAVSRRPLPGLLVDAPCLENQRAFAPDRLAAAGPEHDAGADAYSAAAAARDADRRVDAAPRAHAVGHPGIDVASVAELRAARGRPPAQHHLVVRGAIPAVPRFDELGARSGAAGKQNDHQRCDSHTVLQGNENAPKISPRGVVLQ